MIIASLALAILALHIALRAYGMARDIEQRVAEIEEPDGKRNSRRPT